MELKPEPSRAEIFDDLQRASQTLQALIATIPAGILVADARGQIVLSNPAANEILGGRITGTAYGPSGGYTLHCPDGTPFPVKDLPLVRALDHGETTQNVEILVRPQNGTARNILAAAGPIYDATRRVTGAVAVFQDVTERVQTEAALRRSEERLGEAERIGHMGNWNWEISSNQVCWSDEIYRIFGVCPLDFGATYEAFLSFVHRDDRAMVEEHVRAALDEKQPYSLDHRILRPDGSIRIVHETAEVTFDRDGRPVRMLGTVQDVTEQRQAEEERLRFLRREQALGKIAQALVRERELSRVAAAALEQCLTVLGMDSAALWLADSARHELVLAAQRNLSPETVEAIQYIPYDSSLFAARAARTEQMQVVLDTRSVELPPMARQLYEQAGMHSLLTIPLLVHGRLVGVVSYGTRRARLFSPQELEFNHTVAGLFAVAIENAHLYDEVFQTLRLREEFVSAAAHELRTPVTVIKGSAQRALRTDAHEKRAREALETVDQASDRIARLADDLLTIVRIRPGRSILHPERFDLNTLARTLVEQAHRAPKDKEFRFNTQGALIVDGDRQLIGEVLTRLLENAVRYSPENGRIEVAVRRADGEAVVSVTDHGSGIAPERQPYVFEPFYEVIPAGSPGYVGTVSLGLHLSKQIINVHGGRIWVNSTPGQGTTVSFSLPIVA